MKNVETILQELGIDLGDKAEDFKKEHATNYKTVAEVQQKSERITALENELAEANKALDSVKEASAGDADALKKAQEQIAAFEKEKADREKAETEKADKAAFSERFKKAVGEKTFANDLIASTVEGKAYETSKANPDMDLAAIISGIAGDNAGIWANPQTDPHKMPSGSTAQGVPQIRSLDDLANATPEFINEHWEEIQKLMKE